uniref:Uncharacterized protein n=1 Tax=Rhizophora mucronata TaxID=61149 RepID=A0A2P2PMA2_RHIMU
MKADGGWEGYYMLVIILLYDSQNLLRCSIVSCLSGLPLFFSLIEITFLTRHILQKPCLWILCA